MSDQPTIDVIASILRPPSPLPQINAALPSEARPHGNIPSLAEQVLEKASQAANGPQFMQLWEGNYAAYFASRNVTDKSHSEADAALCSMLAYWCNYDHALVDQLFRQSGLMRPKWDEKRGPMTYGEKTLALVCKAQNCSPPASAQPNGLGPSPLDIVCLDSVTPTQLEWLWPGMLPHGKISIIAGNPGLGKSQVTLDIAARISTGAAWPTGDTCKEGKVLLVCCEDDPADTIVPRLDAAGANRSNIALLRSVTIQQGGAHKNRALSLDDDIGKISDHLKQAPNTRLIIIDPVSAYMGKTDSHNNAEVRAVLDPLAILAQDHRISILLVTHLNKGSGPAISRMMGSMGFVAVARAAYAITKDDRDQTGMHRLFLPIKANLGPDALGLGYSIQAATNGASHVVWDQNIISGADLESLLEQAPPGEASRLAEAIDWLTAKLSAGPVPTKTLIKEAKQDGVAERTLRRAKDILRADASKNGAGGWDWKLPTPIPGAKP
jgi:putative DNA primase/helicase